MTGLKSGSGDDLWGDDDDAEDAESGSGDEASTTDRRTKSDDDRSGDADGRTPASGDETATDPTGAAAQTRPYIVRRAVQDKSVQFERDERLTFFVHDDVTAGERDLITEVESALGRDVPKFDVREAVYRAALRNPDDVLDELLEMGYTLDEE